MLANSRDNVARHSKRPLGASARGKLLLQSHFWLSPLTRRTRPSRWGPNGTCSGASGMYPQARTALTSDGLISSPQHRTRARVRARASRRSRSVPQGAPTMAPIVTLAPYVISSKQQLAPDKHAVLIAQSVHPVLSMISAPAISPMFKPEFTHSLYGCCWITLTLVVCFFCMLRHQWIQF